MSTPIVFASDASRRKRSFGDDDDGRRLIAPNLGFGEELHNSFPSPARDRIPEEARESSMSAPVSLGALTRSLPGLHVLDDDKDDCGDCGRSCCPFCRAVGLVGGGATQSPNVFKSTLGDPRSSLRDPIMKRLDGPIGPSADYLARVAKPSREKTACRPLLVLSLDGVLDCRLPYHLSGGYTDVLTRPYLKTFMDYVVSLQSPWAVCFYTKLDRKTALKTLRQLNLPTGGPEDDERDNVNGLFARDDMREGWDGGEIECKDLEVLWDELSKEENIRWGPENTVVITDVPGHMKKQPYNYVLAPQLTYMSNEDAARDSFLLLMIAVLRDFESETNFTYHIKEMGYNKLQFWTSDAPSQVNLRNAFLANALAICAKKRINVRALTGNRYK
ncbi:hypothetical protein JCM3774_002372 [Rhodotorula dairenensis]